jgi:hypothetical protein
MASKIETWNDIENRCVELRRRISQRDLSFRPEEIVREVRHQIVDSITERIMENIGAKIDEALKRVFEEARQV